MCAALLCVAGCKTRGATEAAQGRRGPYEPPTRLPLASVELRDRTPSDRRIQGIDEKMLLARVERRLRGAAFIDRGASSGYRLKIEVGASPREGEDGKPTFVAVISARAEAPGIGERALEASTVAPLEGKPALGLARRHVLRTLDHTIDSLLFEAELLVCPAARVIAALEQQDIDRLVSVIEVIATRKLVGAVPHMIALLKHRDRRVSDRAIGALVSLGDRRAVRPLTRLAKFRDSARLASVIDGIGTLGGEEAKAFLEFVADGHADPTVRNLAREALSRMTRGK